MIIVGLVLVLSGQVLQTQPTRARSFGWFAYAPLQDSGPPTAARVVLDGQQVVGAALVVLGLLVAAALVGYRLGRARQTPVLSV